MIFFDTFLNGKHRRRGVFRYTGKRVNSVVEQSEDNNGQSKQILFLAHFFAAFGHSFGADVFFADKFCRITRFFTLDGEAVAVDNRNQHIFFVNRKV